MALRAVLFGSIGTLVDTSDAQRLAFNAAFRSFNIDVFWSRDTYQSLLTQPGGRNRIANALKGAGIDPERSLVDAIYNEKTSLFLNHLYSEVRPRAGVVTLLEQAGQTGLATAFVCGTDKAVIDALLEGAAGISAASFDVILSSSDARNIKPDPELYTFALAQLGLEPAECVAIEDTITNGRSAQAAGIPVLYTPGEMTAHEDWACVSDQIVSLETLSISSTAVDALRIWHGDQIEQRAA